MSRNATLSMPCTCPVSSFANAVRTSVTTTNTSRSSFGRPDQHAGFASSVISWFSQETNRKGPVPTGWRATNAFPCSSAFGETIENAKIASVSRKKLGTGWLNSNCTVAGSVAVVLLTKPSMSPQ